MDPVQNGVETNSIVDCDDDVTDIRMPTVIMKKRDGCPLSRREIEFFIKGVVNKDVEDSQLGAMLMAIFMKGMEKQETVDLTKYMKESGHVLDWPEEWRDLVVDKHSTGGVGDKASLPLAPALAACGLKVPMISGRGLGHTGGTLDKLESIPGFTVLQSTSWMKATLASVGCCIVGQTDKLVPADRIMYATRDVTGTVSSIPLISGSIISKKAAESLQALVLDVKFGRGAMMTDREDAKELARTLVHVSNGVGMKTTAVMSRMDSPLGLAVGNALEVIESIECLKGKGPKSLRKLVAALGGHLLTSAGKAKNPEDGALLIERTLDDGSALAKFADMMKVQGVEDRVADQLCGESPDSYSCLPQAPHTTTLKATTAGYVRCIDSFACATVCCQLGAGRTKAGQDVDHSVGLQLLVEVGDYVEQGSDWVTVHHSKELSGEHTAALQRSLEIDSAPIPSDETELISDIIEA